MAVPTETAVDPVTLEIIRTGLQSIPDLIEADLMRTAFSPLIYEYKDYAVGLVDLDGRSIAQATHGLSLFTIVMGLAVKDGLAVYGRDRIEPGDVIITNFAAALGQHLNNVAMLTPVFSGGRIVAFMVVTVHWIDIGGRYPGSCIGTDTTELVQEGLHLRAVKLYRRGELVEEVLRIIEYNTRLPDMLLGDIEAQHAGCVKGRQLFEALIARHGEDTVFAAVRAIWHTSEAAARAAVRAVPDGTYTAQSFLDNDGITLNRPIPVEVVVRIRDDEFTVDFSHIGEQVQGPFNSGIHGGGETSARIAFKYLFAPDEASNDGLFKPVNVILPEGKFLSATGTAPLGSYSTPLCTVVDTIIAAMAPVLPERVAAGHHASFGIYGFSGTNPRAGQFFNVFDTAHGGWGGSMHGDGVGPMKTITHADTKDIPIETIEALYPLEVERYAWRCDSAGGGRHRGGLGVDKTLRALAPCHLTLVFERSRCPPWGFAGGLAGEPGCAVVERGSGESRTYHKVSQLPLAPGDKVIVRSGSGGGFGSPLERDLAAVRDDVLAGFVSRAQAEAVYGVVFTADGSLDSVATAYRRAAATPAKANAVDTEGGGR